MKYKLKRSARRRTLAIKVVRSEVTVYAPNRLNEAIIVGWVESKRGWIEMQLLRQEKEHLKVQNPWLQRRICLFGDTLPIEIGEAARSEVRREPLRLVINIATRCKDKERAFGKLLYDFLSRSLCDYLNHTTSLFEQRMAVKSSGLKIRHYTRRWGSCSGRGELSFNLLLAGAPLHIIDYVVVHELAHIHYMDHSSRFWRRVEDFYPAYRDAESWLKLNGKTLEIFT